MSERRVELTAVRHVAGFRRCRYLLEGERIFILFSFFSFEIYTNLSTRVKTLEVWGALEAAETLEVGKACRAWTAWKA